MRTVAIGLLLLQASAGMGNSQSTSTITIKQAVSHNQADPKGAKEIALLDRFRSACDGKVSCSFKGSDLVPSGQFLIEVAYECTDPTGSKRQIGPNQYGGGQTFGLNCE